MKLNWNFLAEWVGGGSWGCKIKTFHGGSMDIFLDCQYHHVYSPHSSQYISYATTWEILSKNITHSIFGDYSLYSPD